MTHIFLEIPGIDPGLKTPADLSHVLRDKKDTIYSITPELVEWIRGALSFREGQLIPDFAHCRFAFGNGAEFIEFDSKGKIKPASKIKPDWYPDPGEFMREAWLRNKEMHDQSIVQFIREFLERFTEVEDRRTHCDLLFDLQLDKVKVPSPIDQKNLTSKRGNKNRTSTKPKIYDLNSFDMFQQFFAHLEMAVNSNQFPTMQILTGVKDISKASTQHKGAARTWFKSITGELPPNNKKVTAGHSEIYCAPILTAIQNVKKYGLEKFYAELSLTIRNAGDLTLDKFTYHLSER